MVTMDVVVCVATLRFGAASRVQNVLFLADATFLRNRFAAHRARRCRAYIPPIP